MYIGGKKKRLLPHFFLAGLAVAKQGQMLGDHIEMVVIFDLLEQRLHTAVPQVDDLPAILAYQVVVRFAGYQLEDLRAAPDIGNGYLSVVHQAPQGAVDGGMVDGCELDLDSFVNLHLGQVVVFLF